MERRPSERPRQGFQEEGRGHHVPGSVETHSEDVYQQESHQGHQEEGRGARGTRDTGSHHVPYSGSGEVHQPSGGTQQGPLAQGH